VDAGAGIGVGKWQGEAGHFTVLGPAIPD